MKNILHTKVGTHNILSYVAECPQCRGTGLYTGFAERDGAAVVCKGCEGTGRIVQTIHFEDFTGRKQKAGIKRVLLCNPGIQVGSVKGSLERFGGMPYKDWAAGKKFPAGHEMREFTCPNWYYQSANSDLRPDWPECHENFGRSYSQCKRFKNKAKCWEKFDKGNK